MRAGAVVQRGAAVRALHVEHQRGRGAQGRAAGTGPRFPHCSVFRVALFHIVYRTLPISLLGLLVVCAFPLSRAVASLPPLQLACEFTALSLHLFSLLGIATQETSDYAPMRDEIGKFKQLTATGFRCPFFSPSTPRLQALSLVVSSPWSVAHAFFVVRCRLRF